jgi:hypothetical protein
VSIKCGPENEKPDSLAGLSGLTGVTRGASRISLAVAALSWIGLRPQSDQQIGERREG